MSERPPLPPSARRAQSFHDEDEPRRKRRMSTPLIILLVLGGGVVAFGALVALFMYATEDLPVEASDRQVLVTAEVVGEWIEDYTPDPTRETVTKQRYFDGSVELTYEYDDEDLYVSCDVTVEPSISDAKASYVGMQAGISLGIAMSDEVYEKQPGQLEYGDVSEYAVLMTEARDPYGNSFLCRSGKRLFMVQLSGIYFDDPEQLRELLLPVLQRVESYDP